MAQVFISYRRDDSSAKGYARIIADRLMAHFDGSSVFFDLRLEPGTDFDAAIRESVRSSVAMLAIIGNGWVNNVDRLQDSEDYVALELRMALRLGIPVFPILVDGSEMPHRATLPADLQEIAHKTAIKTDEGHFEADLVELLALLDSLMGTTGPPARDYFFGYFCVEDEGRETVLASVTPENQLRFPIAGFARYGEPIHQEIDRAVVQFVPKIEHLDLTALPPVILDLSAGGTFLPTLNVNGREEQIRPFFFKVPLTQRGLFIRASTGSRSTACRSTGNNGSHKRIGVPTKELHTTRGTVAHSAYYRTVGRTIRRAVPARPGETRAVVERQRKTASAIAGASGESDRDVREEQCHRGVLG